LPRDAGNDVQVVANRALVRRRRVGVDVVRNAVPEVVNEVADLARVEHVAEVNDVIAVEERKEIEPDDITEVASISVDGMESEDDNDDGVDEEEAAVLEDDFGGNTCSLA